VFAPITLGYYASGRATARLYLNGGVFHSDPELSDVWDALSENGQTFVEHAFRMYESKVRLVLIELKLVIDLRGAPRPVDRHRNLLGPRLPPADVAEATRVVGWRTSCIEWL
jgi:hypothetical protein